MYLLSFKHSRSIYFEKGLALAQRLGGTWDGTQLKLQVKENELLDAYYRLLPLLSIVQNWSSLKATFNGKEVHPYRFILAMHFIEECAEERRSDSEVCHVRLKEPGWGCKKLRNIYYIISGTGNYNFNEKYWYNFGKFNASNEWVIDKENICERLMGHASEQGLILCPYFHELDVRNAVDQLPSKIIPDNIAFRVHYEEDFYKGKKIKVPVNIRHISEEYDNFDFNASN